LKTFDTFEDNIGLKECVKRPVIVHALQINYPFRVKSLDGNFTEGMPGDYLFESSSGAHYAMTKEVFEDNYDFLEDV